MTLSQMALASLRSGGGVGQVAHGLGFRGQTPVKTLPSLVLRTWSEIVIDCIIYLLLMAERTGYS